MFERSRLPTAAFIASAIGSIVLGGCAAYSKDTVHFTVVAVCEPMERLDVKPSPTKNSATELTFACTNKDTESHPPSYLQLIVDADSDVFLANSTDRRYQDVHIYAKELTGGDPMAEISGDNVITVLNSDDVIVSNPKPLQSRRA